MADQTVIRTIRVRGVPEGIDELTGKLRQLAGAQENVALVSEQSAKRTLSLEAAYKKQTMQLDESARNQARIASATKIADGALREGLITQQQHAERLNLISQRYAAATVQAGKFAGQTGLNRYELLNLSRQMQDVGVSLASGQSPFVVLTQQGSQILDVFQATTGSVRGFFAQAIGWAARFATSTAGVVTGVVGIGAAALYMGQSFATAQREIDKALSGIGAASGVTRSGINRIASESAGGLSIAEAREAASAFAATGKIYEQNIRSATLVTKEFALAMGVETSEATKQLAKDLSGDLVAAALKWNATLGFADGKTIDYIQSLVSMGQRQQAINALLTEAAPAIGRMAENTGLLSRAWTAATNAVSNYADAAARATARGLERVTGANLGGFSDEERLANLRQNRSARAAGTFALGLDAPAIRALDREIAQLEQRIADLAKQGERVRFAQMSLEAREFAHSVNEGTARVEKLTQGLANLEQVQAARINRGGVADAGLESAAQVARVQLALALEQEQVEQRKANVISQNAIKYQDTTVAIANRRELLDAQLGVAQAITGQDEIAAQHHLTIVTLKQQGLKLSDATAIADLQRTNTLAQANAEADRALINLQQQGELIRASSGWERDRIRARQTYQFWLDKGVGSLKAEAIANKQLRNAEEERARAEQEGSEQAIRNIKSREDAWRSYAQGVISWSVANQEAGKILRRTEAAAEESAAAFNRLAGSMFNAANAAVIAKTAFIPFSVANAGDAPGALAGTMGKNLFESRSGGLTQFNPEGYKFTTETLPLQYAKNVYGAGGYDANFQPNATGITNLVNSYLAGNRTIATAGWAEGGGVMGAIEGLLAGRTTGGGVMFGGGGLSPDTLQVVQRLTELLPDDQKAGVIEREIAMLRAQPQNLETLAAIKQLTDSLAQLRQSTDTLADTMTDVLSPFYATDPRQTHLGFRPFASGGIAMTETYARIAEREPEVVAPLSSLPAILRQAANSNEKSVPPVVVNITVQGNADQSTVDALKRTSFQQAQAMRRALG